MQDPNTCPTSGFNSASYRQALKKKAEAAHVTRASSIVRSSRTLQLLRQRGSSVRPWILASRENNRRRTPSCDGPVTPCGRGDFNGDNTTRTGLNADTNCFRFSSVSLSSLPSAQQWTDPSEPLRTPHPDRRLTLEGSMKMSSSDSYFYAAIVAVLAVHVVLALFVYVAWNEGTPKGKGKHD
ncbi:vacuolar ATPase assembly integral membrane protein vma21 isoform X1 [Xiphias gladius]|uniref:vacuolar ATPase assembly integral membrane protein vma21 isoform X1 n=1 Tax=Xiphias gladius TaxID=8245 RepID=UPI001A9815BA|nr:vacuolar ATPase assembly integral membrane protein vma21 isoform X1 [Xiphias gladius]